MAAVAGVRLGGGPGDLGYAPEFFSPLPVTVVDYTPAMDVWRSGGDPFSVAVPLQPSFEDRRGAPDRVFASLDDADFERQVSAWSHAAAGRWLGGGGAGPPAPPHPGQRGG